MRPARITTNTGAAANSAISRPTAQAEQSLKSGHRLPPSVVTKDELVQVHLELLLAHSVVGSDEPLLEIADRAVCKGNRRLGALPERHPSGLDACHMK